MLNVWGDDEGDQTQNEIVSYHINKKKNNHCLRVYGTPCLLTSHNIVVLAVGLLTTIVPVIVNNSLAILNSNIRYRENATFLFDNYHRYDIWVLSEHDVKESRCKLFTIEFGYYFIAWVLGFHKVDNNNMVWLEYDKEDLPLHDLVTHQKTSLQIFCHDQKVFSYRVNLVTLKSKTIRRRWGH